MALQFNPFTGTFDVTTKGDTGTVAAAGDGTAALPGIAFANDLNTGIYRPGADQLAISTNGTGRLFVDASGNVGVGTSPVQKLHVDGNVSLGDRSGSGSQYVGFTAFNLFGGGSSSIEFTRDGSTNTGMRFRLNGTEQFRFLSGATTELMRLDNSGRLGLGTSAPAHKLTVSTGVDTDAGEITIGLGSVTAGATRQATITKNTTSPFSLTFAASNGGTPVDTIFKRDGTNESARIDGNGRLLVGTSTSTSVNAPVQIVAATTSLEHVAGSNFAGDGVYVFASRSRGSASSRTAVQNEDNLARYVFQGYSAAAGAFRSAAEISAWVDGEPDTAGDTTDMPGRLVFSTTADGAASPTERMRITSDGTIRLLNSPGIDFSQIQTNAAGMTSETLDSYEEGTWGNAAVMVNRRYVKIGRLVHLTIEASIPSSGAAFSQTLPFAVATGTGGFAAIEVGSWFVRYNINPFPVYTPVQAAYLRVSGTGIFLGKSGAGSTITRAELETAIGGGVTVDSFFASISYYAAT